MSCRGSGHKPVAVRAKLVSLPRKSARGGGVGFRMTLVVEDRAARLAALSAMIGRTPLLAIRYRCSGQERCIYAKHEARNMTGSIKDRMALQILQEAVAGGRLREGDRIVEASSGNTGIAFAALGRALGHAVRIYMPDWMSRERRLLMQSLGAEIVLVGRDEGGFVGACERARLDGLGMEPVFCPGQFESAANVRAHERGTGQEALRQLAAFGQQPAAVVAGVGTGGTVMGLGRAFRAAFPDVRVHPLEPANSPTLRTGTKVGSHRIQGIADDFVPAILDLAALDGIVDVWDGDAILMAQALATQLGLAVGISSGANVVGAIAVAEAMAQKGRPGAVVTVLPDSNKKYLSTDLCQPQAVEPGYLSPHVELLGFDAQA